MSAGYRAVQWNVRKIAIDSVAVAFVFAYTMLFETVGRALFRGDQAITSQILSMRAWGTCAFVLLSFVLAIGPLARLEKRFAPLLYNRRHLGVLTCFVALRHAYDVVSYYFAYGESGKLEAALTYDQAFSARTVPFIPLGMGALAILVVMAATSHDFWQKFFGARVWKNLHMLVYLCYGLVVAHVAFGALQSERHPAFAVAFVAMATIVASLHVVASRRSNAKDHEATKFVEVEGVRYIDAGRPEELREDRACPVVVPGAERIALVKWNGKIAAMHGVCAHQGGPLYEGRVIDGCLTCPWHGWQYRPGDGQAPPPFVEKLPTYRLRLKDGRVLVDPRPLPPGTATEPIEIASEARPELAKGAA